MALVTSKVYDIIHPSPVWLKQLSAIAVSLEIWRLVINEYRTGGKLENIHARSVKADDDTRTMIPDLPFTIYKTIGEFVSRFGRSMGCWLERHYEYKPFSFRFAQDEKQVLKYLDDFKCDYDGYIDYARTAERMMRCTKFTQEMKFEISCIYFFEDDIRLIWPSVSDYYETCVVNEKIDFYECPLLYYWIYRLTNKLDQIPYPGSDETVNERMLFASMPCNNSIEYFWNRIPAEEKVQKAVYRLIGYNFVRFVLPKLDDQQLDKFVNDSDTEALFEVFQCLHCDKWIVLRTWLHIRDIIKESNFTNLIIRMFDTTDGAHWQVEEHYYDEEKWRYACCQIWNHTPPTLKPSVIRVIFSSDRSWFEDLEYINTELLFTILLGESLEKRNLFWRNRWRDLIKVVQRSKDLQRLMELCFENENEIYQFKRSVMAKSEHVFQYGVTLLRSASFEKLKHLSEFLSRDGSTSYLD